MPAKKKIAQDATDTDIEQVSSEVDSTPSENSQISAAETEQMSKPMSQKERLEQLEQKLALFDAQADANFKNIRAYLTKLQPLIDLSEQLANRQAQPQTQGQPTQPSMSGIPPELLQIGQMLMNSGSSTPGQEIFMKWQTALLEREMAKITAPSTASAFEKAFEEEFIKAKAKVAASLIAHETS